MSRRLFLPVVLLCAVVVTLVAAVQGPIVFGEPRFDLVLPQSDTTMPPPSKDAPPGNEVPENTAPAPNGIFNPTTLLIALASLVAAALVALAFYIVRAIHRRRRIELSAAAVSTLPGEPAAEPLPESSTVAPALARGIERALTVLDTHPDPQNAIVEAWLGLQQSAEDSGLSLRASETPAEFTVRVLAREQSIDAELATLLALYQDVRFGDRPVTASEIEHARSALRTIQDVWS